MLENCGNIEEHKKNSNKNYEVIIGEIWNRIMNKISSIIPSGLATCAFQRDIRNTDYYYSIICMQHYQT